MSQHPTPFADQSVAYEHISCDLCASRDQEVLGYSSGGGERAVICRSCGLIFISPRMTRLWYDRYYQREYREGSGQPVDMDRMFAGGLKHGRALSSALRPYLFDRGLLIEVGSSTGGVLAGLREALGVRVIGIEPSVREAGYATARSIPTHATLIEDSAVRGIVLPPAEQILSVQSLNHFLSPRFFFTWAWRQLQPGGRLIIEVKNFRQQVRRSGRIGNSIQLDHLYMFTPETLSEYLRAAGFRILVLDSDERLSLREIAERRGRGLPGYQIRAVAEKLDIEPFSQLDQAIDPRAYAAVRASLRPWRTFLHHFFRYRKFNEFVTHP